MEHEHSMISDPERHLEAPAQDSATAIPQPGSSRHRTQELSVRGFAKAVWNFSKLSTGAGYHHERIARFLSRLLNTPDNEFKPPVLQEDFLTLYRFDQKTRSVTFQIPEEVPVTGQLSSEKSSIPAIWQLRDANHFRTCYDFHQYKILSDSESPGQILFLKGYPSPEWLGLTGSRYHVDPEFFSRFLDFRTTDNLSNRISVPSLPSCEWNIIELSLSTIGLMNPLASHGQQTKLATIRRRAAVALAEKNSLILRNSHVSVGCTMIRAVDVLDQTNFAIEQRIAICLQPAENDRGWMVLIWTDSGSRPGVDFVEGPLSFALGLSQPLKHSLLPVVNYKPMMGLKSNSISRNAPNDCVEDPQSVPALHLGYGRSLRTKLAARDPFYCLTEVFALVASSEKQFLNLIELKLENSVFDHRDSSHNDSLETLRYFNAVLYRHARHIKTTLSSISSTSHSKWPKAEGEPTKRARSDVEQDFMHLHQHAEALSRQCQEEITVLMNSMAIRESEKAIAQAGRLEQLTFLAFLFVPISFVSSFFSMNVPQLQNVQLWTWFAVSTGVLVVSIVFYLYHDNVRKLGKRLMQRLFP